MAELSYLDISFLTFQAVVEVIIICFAGYICAKVGLLNPNAQKQISQLNVDLFTPALIFSKLAPSLSFKKLIEIAVIPLFYVVSTLVSYLCSQIASFILKLNEPETNYVTAMSVFGNSNSLPVSLTIALSYTLPNLLWDDVEDDSPDKIASRGILYLLIFQQLGQVLRWSWGYNTLLKKRTHDEIYQPNRFLIKDTTSTSSLGKKTVIVNKSDDNDLEYQSLLENHQNVSDSSDDSIESSSRSNNNTTSVTNANITNDDDTGIVNESTSLLNNNQVLNRNYHNAFLSLDCVKSKITNFKNSFLAFMNPPLYSMAAAVFVASVPYLQKAFYVDDGFIQNTAALAIKQMGSVSIPLILVVLGSNLYPSPDIKPATPNYNKIIIGSLVSRMILPPIILLPLIAICVKYLPISILDDPIFLVVAFILTISPPAIQLSQICQLNELYEKEMAGVLFWGYVVLTLPTTIAIVVASLEVLKWSNS